MLNHMFISIRDLNLQQEQDKVKSWQKTNTHNEIVTKQKGWEPLKEARFVDIIPEEQMGAVVWHRKIS